MEQTFFQGLKTGMYYLRTKPASNALQFTVDKQKLKVNSTSNDDEKSSVDTKSALLTREEEEARMVCSRENAEACMMCSG